jgi:hypothetical protein
MLMPTNKVIPRVRQVLAHAVCDMCEILKIPEPMRVLNAHGRRD